MYTTILHPIRKMYNLSLIEYCILEEVRVLSHSNNGYGGWCVKSKVNIADGLDISRATAFRGLKTLEEKNLIERNEDGLLRCSDEWLTKISKRELEAFSDGETGSLKMTPPPSQNETTPRLKMRPKNNNKEIHKEYIYNFDQKSFDDFWISYDRKVSKQLAVEQWKKKIESAEHADRVILAAKNYAKTTEQNFRLHPFRWLRDRRWEDEVSGETNYETMTLDEAKRILRSGTESEIERLTFGNPKLYLKAHG